MIVVDLFSGIGGFSLGLERAGMETIAFCEQDKFCQKVLAKHWPKIPIFDDVRTLDGEQFRGAVDVVCGGFPCQPFSVAGKQKGKSDERHLWPEMLRIIRECQPTWVVCENVGGFVNMALDDCWADLEAEGYEVQSFIIPACSVEARHKRDRCWILAHANRNRRTAESVTGSATETTRQESKRKNDTPDTSRTSSVPASRRDVADTACVGVQGLRPSREQVTDTPGEARLSLRESETGGRASRNAEPRLGGAADGLPSWMDGFSYIGNPDDECGDRVTERKDDRAKRIKALGNSVVPQIPEIIGRAIMHIEIGGQHE